MFSVFKFESPLLVRWPAIFFKTPVNDEGTPTRDIQSSLLTPRMSLFNPGVRSFLTIQVLVSRCS
ncbi:hypothetical protein EBR21_16155 [bacterium]|nr:hypothetical protein [bacterium]